MKDEKRGAFRVESDALYLATSRKVLTKPIS
jgi:hypothetical protein